MQRLGGTVGWMFSRAIPVRDQHGTVVEWFGAATDITARKQAEHARLSNEKLAAVGCFGLIDLRAGKTSRRQSTAKLVGLAGGILRGRDRDA